MDKLLNVPAHSSLELTETELQQGEYSIVIEPHASLTYVISLDKSSIETTLRIRVDTYATCKLIILMHGITQKITCDFLLYQHAKLDVKGALLLAGTNKIECLTTQRHKEPSAQSSVLIKTMLYDVSTFDYRGTIIVDEKAQHTSASQYNKNLMLSPQARTTSIPSLEVIADSVSCKHGTANASLSEEHLAYLQSRGIHPDQARHLLTAAFFDEINNVIPHGAVRDGWFRLR